MLIDGETTRDELMTRQVEVIGHRGARGLFPENTLDGFRQARALGVRSFELDAGMTADGVVVVSHDLVLNPDITRDGEGRFLSAPAPSIHQLTFDALQAYDVGRIRPVSRYRLSHRVQAPNDGARIPALEQVLRLVPDARFIIELKTDPRHPDRTVSAALLADAVLAVVDATQAASRVILESFDWRGPRHIRRLRPAIATAWLTRDETVRDAKLWWDGETPARHGGSIPAAVAAQGGEVWAPAYETLTRALVTEAHDLGLRVIPWTVNRRAAMRRLMAWDVDGLITDRPDVAMTVTADHGGQAAG
jgi:glycerophosphoryl diester phosphodiesterase